MAPGKGSKRKRSHDPSTSVRLGNKVISLEGYLNPSETSSKKKARDAATRSENAESAPSQEPTEQPKQSEPHMQKNQRHRLSSQRNQDEGDPVLLKKRQALPIWDHREEIRQILRDSNILLLVGETGSGKSTQVPQFLMNEPWCRGTIAITQPRRVAATTLAHRVSKEVGTPLRRGSPKGLVGYSVRFDHHVPRGTKIKFLTEGMLLQELMSDPQLRQYSAIIVDEVHERSVDVDLLLGFLKRIQASQRVERPKDPLKVVVMSATANVEKIQGFFSGLNSSNPPGSTPPEAATPQCRYLEIPGRQYPVEIVHLPKPVPDIQDALCQMVLKINAQDPFPGDVLAFLTGQEEIEAAQNILEEEASKLSSDLPKLKVFPLFVLTMKSRGIEDILSFPLMDMPDIESLEKALIHLFYLGAVGDNGSITNTGKRMSRFPVTPPYARVLLAAAEAQYDCLLEVIDIISCITAGEDIFHQLVSEVVKEEVEVYRKELYRREGDLLTYLTTMQRYTAENTNRMEWCKARRINVRNIRQALNIRRQLRSLCLREKMLAEAPPADPQPFTPLSPERAEAIIKCFLEGFALKTAMLAPDGSYVTTQGKHVVAVHPSSVLHGGEKREAIMFVEHVFTQKNYAKKVTAIQADWIADTLEKSRS